MTTALVLMISPGIPLQQEMVADGFVLHDIADGLRKHVGNGYHMYPTSSNADFSMFS